MPVFVKGLTSNKDAEIRSKILSKLKMDPILTLQRIAEEFQHSVNLKLDTAGFEEKENSQVHIVQPTKMKNYRRCPTLDKTIKEDYKIRSISNICHGCGGKHFKKDQKQEML